MNQRAMALLLAVAMLAAGIPAMAENADAQQGQAAQLPEMPEGMELPEGMENPPERPEGMENPPELPEGMENPPERPEVGMGGAPGGMGGGMSGAPDAYDAVNTVEADARFTGEIASTGADENAIHVISGTAEVTDAQITRENDASTGGDSASFYGVGAAVLATGGEVNIEESVIVTDAAGAAGVFAYGEGVARVRDTAIATKQNTSGGIHVAGGGTLYASNLTVTTEGESSAAIRSDRGSGTMIVDGGTYESHGVGSPAVYVTADITIHDAQLTATGSEALCMEGLNTVRLYDCALSGAMQDLDVNSGNTWNVIVYQSMSGDAAVGKGRFEMVGGTLEAANGGLFYTTNTESEFVLQGVTIEAAEDSEYFLRCTGNDNQRGWGAAGSNGAQCTFTALAQQMPGDVIWDSVSTLDLYIAEGSQLVGAVVQDESCAGDGGDGACTLTIDADSAWIVTGDSRVSALHCAGLIEDEDGCAVTIVDAAGNVLAAGESAYTITVDSFDADCDMSGASMPDAWETYAATMDAA